MQNKELIIQLIQVDLKHNQLTEGLRHLGLDDEEKYNLNLLPVVAQLMGIPKGGSIPQWDHIYISFLEEAHQHPVSILGEELYPIAEKCYEMLYDCIEIRISSDT